MLFWANSGMGGAWWASSVAAPVPKPCFIAGAGTNSVDGRYLMPVRLSCLALPRPRFLPSKRSIFNNEGSKRCENTPVRSQIAGTKPSGGFKPKLTRLLFRVHELARFWRNAVAWRTGFEWRGGAFVRAYGGLRLVRPPAPVGYWLPNLSPRTRSKGRWFSLTRTIRR